MSVPEGRRGLSEMEFYRTAVNLRTELTEWILRDFGIRPKIRKIGTSKSIALSIEDKAILDSIVEKYGMKDVILDYYPEWWIYQRRIAIDNFCVSILEHIRIANSIYAVCEVEYNERRRNQTIAIGECEALLEEVQFVIAMIYKTIGIDVSRYGRFIDLLTRELSLLRAWRKSDNKILKRIKCSKG